jgi:hypothetical protein
MSFTASSIDTFTAGFGAGVAVFGFVVERPLLKSTLMTLSLTSFFVGVVDVIVVILIVVAVFFTLFVFEVIVVFQFFFAGDL